MLLSKKRAYWSVVPRIGLERASNVDGIDFAKMTFALDRPLTPQERETFRPIQRKMTALLDPIIIDQSDYITHEPANADPAPPFRAPAPAAAGVWRVHSLEGRRSGRPQSSDRRVRQRTTV